jgi:hypothetical protein
VEDGFIVRDARTRHGMNKVIPLSKAFQHPGTEDCPIDLNNDYNPNVPESKEEDESRTASHTDGVIVLDEDMTEPSQGTANKPILIPDHNGGVQGMGFVRKDRQYRTSTRGPVVDAQEIFHNLVHTAEENTHLQDTLVADLRSICEKYKHLLATDSALGKRHQTNPQFPQGHRDRKLKRYKSFLEPKKESCCPIVSSVTIESFASYLEYSASDLQRYSILRVSMDHANCSTEVLYDKAVASHAYPPFLITSFWENTMVAQRRLHSIKNKKSFCSTFYL